MAIVLSNTAKFTPYTFDEMLKPYAMATAEHRAVEEGLAELGSKAELMRKYANEEPNADWAKAYNQYASELENAASDLAKYGLGPTNRSSMLGLKRRYSSAVSPIEEGAKELEEIYKTMRNNPNNIYRNNGVVTMSDVLNNTVDMSYLDEKTIMAESAIGAKAAGQEALQNVINSGGTSEQGLTAARIAADNYKNTYLNSLGINSFNTTSKDRINKAIDLGIEGAFTDIAKGEYLNAKEREIMRLSKQSADRQWTQYVGTMKRGGHNPDGSADVDNPYWTIKGVKYNKDTKTWDVTEKPGTAKSDKSTTSSSKKESNIAYGYQIAEPMMFNSEGQIVGIYDNKMGGVNALKGHIPISYEGLMADSSITEATKRAVSEGIEGMENSYVFCKKGDNVLRVPKKSLRDNSKKNDTNSAEQNDVDSWEP